MTLHPLLILSAAFFFIVQPILGQKNLQTPLEKSGYASLSSSTQVFTFLGEVANNSSCIRTEIIGTTSAGKEITAAIITKDKKVLSKKLRVMIFAQQHGNEASGKEAALVLIRDFGAGKLDVLLSKMDIIIVPQVNPDGADLDQRRNGLGVDLNRNHLLIDQNESLAIHHLYDRYLPDITLDVHEYYPWDDTTSTFKLIRNYDEQLGLPSNPNIGKDIRDFSRKYFLPTMKQNLNDNGFSFSEYIVGSIAENQRMRYSTIDIDDARNGFGIYGSFSFIAEGLNGSTSHESIERRSKGQLELMMSLLNFADKNQKEIKKLVKKERKRLLKSKERIALRMEHVADGSNLSLSLFDVSTKQVSDYPIEQFHPKVEVLEDIDRPLGYLVPGNDETIKAFMDRHRLYYFLYSENKKHEISVYRVNSEKRDTLEEMNVADANVQKLRNYDLANPQFYFFVPLSQIKSNLIAIAFEPRSMLGLVNYEAFEYLLEEERMYPILRVEEK